MIHDCQHSGLRKKEWLSEHGISKDTYYYWYNKVQTACAEAMELPDTIPVPEFVPLPVPAEVNNEAKTAHSVTPPAVVSIHLDKARIDIPEATSMDSLQKNYKSTCSC